jgi:hypothetical protein
MEKNMMNKPIGWKMSVAAVFTFAAILVSSNVNAQTSGAAFLKTTPDPRAFALGMSGVVSSLGARAISANPANLAQMPKRYEIFSSFATMMSGAQYGHLAASYAPSKSGMIPLDGLGISATQLRVGSMQQADAAGNQTGSGFGAGNLAVALSGSRKINSAVGVGLTVKAIQAQIAGYRSNTALAADIGMSVAVSRVTLGFSANNLGQGIRFLDQTDPLPSSINMGLSMPLGPVTAMATASRFVAERRNSFGLGMEYGLGPVSFRGGFSAQTGAGKNLALADQGAGGQAMAGMLAGAGVRLGSSARLDYAVSQEAMEYGFTQRVSFSLQFGGQGQEESRPQPRVRRAQSADTGWIY